MNGTTKTTQTVTVDGDGVLAAFDALIKAHEVGLHALRNLRAALLAGRAKASGEGRSGLLSDFPTIEKQTAPQTTRDREDVATPSRRAEVPKSAAPLGVLGKAERAILHTIAQRSPQRTSRAQAAVLSGYSLTSSSFSNALSELRSLGYISGHGDDLTATDDGRAVASTAPLPKGADLVAMWSSKLGQCERKLLETLVANGRVYIARDDLAEVSGYSPTSSSFANALSKLRTLKLAHGSKHIVASQELM